MGAVLVEPGLGARGAVGRRQPEQRQKVTALEMRALFFKLGSPFGVDQPRCCIRKRSAG